MGTQNEETLLTINMDMTKNNDSNNQNGTTIKIAKKSAYVTLSWIFGIMAFGIFIGLMVFAGISNCHVEKPCPAIYHKKTSIIYHNKSGFYASIELCKKNPNDFSKQKTRDWCKYYECLITTLQDDNKYNVTTQDECLDSSSYYVYETVRVWYTDDMVMGNVVSQCKITNYCTFKTKCAIILSVLLVSFFLFTILSCITCNNS